VKWLDSKPPIWAESHRHILPFLSYLFTLPETSLTSSTRWLTMDPFVALAVAGNILQFVQFVGGLFSSTRKIYLSMTGIASDAGYDICEKLIGFSSKLEYSLKNHANSPNSADGGQPSEYGPALAECAASCREDCAALIEITRKLRQKAGGKTPRWWKSFHAALEEVWRSNEIDGLQKRIADRQRWMIIQLCAISK